MLGVRDRQTAETDAPRTPAARLRRAVRGAPAGPLVAAARRATVHEDRPRQIDDDMVDGLVMLARAEFFSIPRSWTWSRIFRDDGTSPPRPSISVREEVHHHLVLRQSRGPRAGHRGHGAGAGPARPRRPAAGGHAGQRNRRDRSLPAVRGDGGRLPGAGADPRCCGRSPGRGPARAGSHTTPQDRGPRPGPGGAVHATRSARRPPVARAASWLSARPNPSSDSTPSAGERVARAVSFQCQASVRLTEAGGERVRRLVGDGRGWRGARSRRRPGQQFPPRRGHEPLQATPRGARWRRTRRLKRSA